MIGRLHVITDTRPGRDPVAVVAAALEAGAPVIQVRGKELTDRQLYELTCRVRDRCASHGALCLVNDRIDVALATGADGAHLGDHDLPVAVARRVLDGCGPGSVLGATARNPATAVTHQAAGATYLGVGPCFATATKHGLPPPLEPALVASIAAAVEIPVIAVAGVTAARVPELVERGVHGVAVIGAVSDADDPHAAVEELLRALECTP
jgi:thiamine-phosphate pyrophosphorylase